MHPTLATSIVALVLAVFAAAAPQPTGERSGLAIPITKRSNLMNGDGTISLEALDSHVKSVTHKILRGFDNYERNTGKQHPSATSGSLEKRGAGVGLTFESYDNTIQNEYWVGTIGVGTPPQPILVEFNTGSSELVIRSCPLYQVLQDCMGYDPGFSSTANDLQDPFQFFPPFEGRSASGTIFNDTVTITGYTAINQTLGAAYIFISFLDAYPDGAMGMAFKSISEFSHAPSVFETLVDQRKLPNDAFSFKLAITTISGSESELYIGGANDQLYTGEFTYTPVTVTDPPAFWQVEMDLQVNGYTTFTNLHAIIETGSSLIIGDEVLVHALHSFFNATEIGNGQYAFRCEHFPTMNLVFGGTSFPITAVNLGHFRSGSDLCLSGIQASGLVSGFWVIGDIFLQGVYTTFDYANLQVGFAKLTSAT